MVMVRTFFRYTTAEETGFSPLSSTAPRTVRNSDCAPAERAVKSSAKRTTALADLIVFLSAKPLHFGYEPTSFTAKAPPLYGPCRRMRAMSLKPLKLRCHMRKERMQGGCPTIHYS